LENTDLNLDKQLITKLLTESQSKVTDINHFVVQYVYATKKQELSAQQLATILQALQGGLFNLRFALLRAAQLLNLNVLTVFNKQQQYVKTLVYE
jgi:predicted transcriptional regulator YheO